MDLKMGKKVSDNVTDSDSESSYIMIEKVKTFFPLNFVYIPHDDQNRSLLQNSQLRFQFSVDHVV